MVICLYISIVTIAGVGKYSILIVVLQDVSLAYGRKYDYIAGNRIMLRVTCIQLLIRL